jgi:hypothetical protein
MTTVLTLQHCPPLGNVIGFFRGSDMQSDLLCDPFLQSDLCQF